MAICSTCKEEYIGETEKGKTRVRFYWQHIRQPHFQQLKCKKHFQTCEKRSFFSISTHTINIPQRFCGNLCIWAHDVRLHIAVTNDPKSAQQAKQGA